MATRNAKRAAMPFAVGFSCRGFFLVFMATRNAERAVLTFADSETLRG
jgi:hypothetical protein